MRSCSTIIAAFAILTGIAVSACQNKVETNENVTPQMAVVPRSAEIAPAPPPTPVIPDLQKELLDDRHKTTTSPIGTFDFKNYTYELPRGWQNPDGTAEIKLTNGKIAPVSRDVNEKMADDEKAEAKQQRRIGMSFVTAKYFDATGDGEDEAIVVLKVETGGSAIPQLVYVFSWKDDAPELIWPFRTGDRADGGLKDLRLENGNLVIELYGQDRFILGQTETGKITNDIEQLCCPTYFSRSVYKWNGKNFLIQGKRLTFSISDPGAPPIENLGDIVNNPAKSKK
jgi:hypothetical protein